MITLFDIIPELPPGFHYYPDFITKDEEQQLTNLIESYDLAPMQFHQYEAKRKVKSFGKGWSFTEQRLKESDPIPGECFFLLQKIAQQLNIETTSIVQMLITEYPVGALINWHRDAPPFHTVAGISLLSSCNFRLRPHDAGRQTKSNLLKLTVERRSLYTMQGPAKDEWQHSTAGHKQTRYSLTFRTLK